MQHALHYHLLHREINAPPRSHRKLYASRSLIADFDIVNELAGHSGCVNALSWSRSGHLLASGSDDQHLNIHSYQPSDNNDQFKLTATVATGHTANIFSVKFMPGHADRTVVTAAGDGEVRVFDLEYAGQATEASASSLYASEGRRRGRNRVYDGVRYMSDGDTGVRVYRSHGDRVKRIVTESSPNLFLTCSEDGEVRQWDLRQPSSAYPAPQSQLHGGDSGVPAPLISYKRYGLDLNSISCSPSQPHYIALGGAHLHCFLHDRRMTGRDRLRESGKTLSSDSSRTASEEALMAQATQCVRKFAPNGQQSMGRTESGHITACKISDARPDEMIVSWSGDHIYSFDLLRSPDAGEQTAQNMKELISSEDRRAKRSPERKRKRAAKESSISDAPSQAGGSVEGAASALRVRYRNGQVEDIPIARPSRLPLTDRQRTAQRIASAVTAIRSWLFATTPQDAESTAALGQAASIIDEIDDAIREWGYPIDPSPEQVRSQQHLRRGRESARRSIQGAGTLARALGGKLQTLSHGESPMLQHFLFIEARGNELQPTKREQFCYDFVKAILLFLESGVGRLIEGFTRPQSMSRTCKAAQRLPIPEEEATIDAIDEYLIPYLLSLASEEQSIVDLSVNQFEVEENRRLFGSERAAVMAFQEVLRVPFADLSAAEPLYQGEVVQDRGTVREFWLGVVARGLLYAASEHFTLASVDVAFGGVGVFQEDDGEPMTGMEMLDADGTIVDHVNADELAEAMRTDRETERDDSEIREEDLEDMIIDGDEVMTEYPDLDDSSDDAAAEEYDNDEDDGSSEPDGIDGVPSLPRGFPPFLFSSSFERRRHKERVESSIPSSPHTRFYAGHQNTRTVKDVNYFGPEDQYVVSGSDDGNFFLWDRKTTELVYIGEGDGEVVNVAQGHPYESLLAVSGIDHTVKIFSPDARARAKARLGVGVSAHDASQFSSLAFPHRMSGGRRRSTRPSAGTSDSAVPGSFLDDDDTMAEDERFVVANGLASRNRSHQKEGIVARNEAERAGGVEAHEGFVSVSQARLLQMLFGRLVGGELG
ncbi:hypothetical protein LTR62_007538 [Meristemomyces frigidus]|uniref:WD40 repeat-like protein n=1 Tax=Meristemomyces frigidus TaxID=1508187 RepID=A0AAN7TIW1_9PEZI|nr:hypothetical protein LTR62_007538 [Meristemomyces frigidus]